MTTETEANKSDQPSDRDVGDQSVVMTQDLLDQYEVTLKVVSESLVIMMRSLTTDREMQAWWDKLNGCVRIRNTLWDHGRNLTIIEGHPLWGAIERNAEHFPGIEMSS